MSSIKNKVQLIGNLGKDPEVNVLQTGKHVANFSMATTETFKNDKGEKEEKTEWHNCVAWGKTAEIISKYVFKGDQVAIEGKLTHQSYEANDGTKKYVTKIVVSELLMMGKKK